MQILKQLFALKNNNIKKMLSNLKQNDFDFINTSTAQSIDEELMGKEYNYTLDQLMEIAGQSVALSIYDCIEKEKSWKNIKKILTLVGPGSKIKIMLKKI